MAAFGRFTLLGSFAAAGMGLALCVGVSMEPPQGAAELEETAPSVLSQSSPPASTTPLAARPVDVPATVPPAAAPVPAARAPVGLLVSDSAATPAVSVVPRRPLIEEQYRPILPVAPVPAHIYPPITQQNAPVSDAERLQQVLDSVRKPMTPPPPPPTALPAEMPLPKGEPPGKAPPQGRVGTPATSKSGPSRIRARMDGSGDGRLTIQIQNQDIHDVLDFLSEQGNLNILAGKSVQGKVTASMTGVDIDSALSAILKSTGYVTRREGKFIFVGTPEEFDTLEQSLDRIATRVYRPNYVPASELQTLIQPILTPKFGTISVSTPAKSGIPNEETSAEGNAFAGGEVVLVRDYEAVLAQVDQLVSEIDVRPPQVAIEAMILSVKLNDENRFGVNFQLLRDKHNIKFGLGKPAENLAKVTFDSGGLKFGFLDSNLGVFLDALETVGDTNVIATPRLMVLNKHRAEILIGEQKGYISTTVTETSSTQTVEFLDVGAQLRLRPFISSDGLIRMEVHPELSSGDVKVEQSLTLPSKEVTQVTTNIMVRDGCTVVIGGLMKDQLTDSIDEIPVLGALPLVGPIFRNKKETIERREVMVLITPHIVYEPDTCREGEQIACEFHRRQSVFGDKLSLLGRRSIARRYFRLAQSAHAVGDRDRALRFAEMAVHFDPQNRAAIDLRSDIWLGKPVGDHTLDASCPGEPCESPLDGQAIAGWVLDDIEQIPAAQPTPLHPLDPGRPGNRLDLTRPRRLQ